MSLSFELYILLALIILYVDILIVFKLIINRLKATNKRERLLKNKNKFIDIFSKKSEYNQTDEFYETYKKVRESILLEYSKLEVSNESYAISKTEKKSIKRLHSFFKLKRIEGAVILGFISSDRARIALETALKKEKDTTVKLYIANALSDIGNSNSIPVLISTLINMHRWYRSRVNTLIINFGEDFDNYLFEIINRKEVEIKELLIDVASVHFSLQLKDYLIKILEQESVEYSSSKYEKMNKIDRCCGNCLHGRNSDNNGDRMCTFKGTVSPYYKCWRFKRLPISIEGSQNRQHLVYRAADILADFYPNVLYDDKYINSKDVRMKNTAVIAISKGNTVENIEKLITLLKDEDVASTSVNCILRIIENEPKLIQTIISRFEKEQDYQTKAHLSEILSYKIEYFIMKLMSHEKKFAREIIEQVLILGRTSEIIDFMNKNKNIDLENELVSIVKKVFCKDGSTLEKEFCQYLNERILNKCGLKPCIEVAEERVHVKDKNVTNLIYITTFCMVLLFPLIFVIRYTSAILSLPLLKQVSMYVIDFNYYIAYYSIAINLIYLILLMLSVINVRRQKKLWELKSSSLLFKDNMLPGISIIAPAFNEEMTIIESANSLLNLVYPDYELIIVNDGSTDQTMNVLIKTFDLKRVDFKNDNKLNTKRVRGVYINESIPKLVVVDKENGGKADSLNTGINKSRKEYFCGIDADSILEPDALLKLASREIDADVETPALGGNVFPANGCTIEKGSIINKGFPKNPLARFQAAEYIRAFMAGRLGWAYSNSLLIISGAFGLFRKERVLDVGGYLTSSGKYEKDTVGEDMELVVRISRLMREKGLKYKIDYVYNANCWTEVPEDIKSFKKQRYRWHRGLIDILSFHRRMIFNPTYGRAGLVAMPYFFIFEFFGPFIEMQGYLMILTAILLGLMNVEIAVLLFISTILMGILVSLSSMLVAQNELEYLTGRDIAIFIFYSIIENFGIRQTISIWRFGATLRLLWKQDGWGKIKRKGFETSEIQQKG